MILSCSKVFLDKNRKFREEKPEMLEKEKKNTEQKSASLVENWEQ